MRRYGLSIAPAVVIELNDEEWQHKRNNFLRAFVLLASNDDAGKLGIQWELGHLHALVKYCVKCNESKCLLSSRCELAVVVQRT